MDEFDYSPNLPDVETRTNLYRSLLEHLDKTIFGEKFDLPRSDSGQYTAALNPIEAFDKEKFPEGMIFSEPDVKWTESISKKDAVRMLAKTARERFGPLLKKQPPEVLTNSGWEGGEFLSISNEGIRASVRDVIKEARRTPDYLLDPLKKIEFVTIPEENVAGRYFSRQLLDDSTPKIDVDPALGSSNTFRHEVGHSRHLDAAPSITALKADKQDWSNETAGDAFKRYMELMTSEVGTKGSLAAKQRGERFYWNNPRELIARRYATLTGGQDALSVDAAEKAYNTALVDVFKKVIKKAPKFSKMVSESSDVAGTMKFRYGKDWLNAVRLGTKKETMDTPVKSINNRFYETMRDLSK